MKLANGNYLSKGTAREQQCCDDAEDLLNLLQSQIADVVANFEQRTDIRVEHLEIDNRMRGIGACAAHNIIVSADID